MKKTVIIGCGAHASEIVEYISHINKNLPKPKYEIIGYLDETEKYYKHYRYSENFLGNINKHKVKDEFFYILGIGNLNIRKEIVDEFTKNGAKFETIIHPTSLVAKNAKIGKGCLISHNVSIGPMAEVGDFCVVNSRATIGHDSKIGENNFISPQVVLGGYTEIGNNNLFGTNSCLIPSIKVGNNNKIMAGMTIVNNVNDNETVFYRHKEKLVFRNNISD